MPEGAMVPLDVTKATQPQYKHMQTYYKHTWYKVEDTGPWEQEQDRQWGKTLSEGSEGVCDVIMQPFKHWKNSTNKSLEFRSSDS